MKCHINIVYHLFFSIFAWVSSLPWLPKCNQDHQGMDYSFPHIRWSVLLSFLWSGKQKSPFSLQDFKSPFIWSFHLRKKDWDSVCNGFQAVYLGFIWFPVFLGSIFHLTTGTPLTNSLYSSNSSSLVWRYFTIQVVSYNTFLPNNNHNNNNNFLYKTNRMDSK